MTDQAQSVSIRWADIDSNRHVRHSVYYDWGADARMAHFRGTGMTVENMERLQVGVILLREECVFRREILPGDEVGITVELVSAKKDFSRWSVRHRILKNDDILCATLTVDGAWIDMQLRKMTVPPESFMEGFNKMDRPEDFKWLD